MKLTLQLIRWWAFLYILSIIVIGIYDGVSLGGTGWLAGDVCLALYLFVIAVVRR